MAVGVVGTGAGATATSPNNVSFTLPGSIPVSSRLYLITSSNQQTAVVNDISNVTETQLDTQLVSTVLNAFLFGADLGSVDSGANVTITWSAGGKLAYAWIVLSGATPTADNQAVLTDAPGTNTACPVPSITPVEANCLLVSLVSGQHATGGTTMSWDSDYTIGAEATGASTTPLQSAHVGYLQLATGAGVARTGDSHTWSANSREASWVLSIAEAGTPGVSDPPIIVMPPRRH